MTSSIIGHVIEQSNAGDCLAALLLTFGVLLASASHDWYPDHFRRED